MKTWSQVESTVRLKLKLKSKQSTV